MNKKPVIAMLSAFGLLVLYILSHLIARSLFGYYFGFIVTLEDSPSIIDGLCTWLTDKTFWMASAGSLLALLLCGALLLILKIKPQKHIPFKPLSFKTLFWVVCAASGFQWLSIMLINSLEPYLPLESSINQLNFSFKNCSFTSAIIALIFITPLSEELIFRGLIFKKLKLHLPYKFALIFQALLFSLMNFNLAQIIVASILGIILGNLCQQTQTILAPIAFRIAYNVCGFIILSLNHQEQMYFCFVLFSAAVVTGVKLCHSVYASMQMDTPL